MQNWFTRKQDFLFATSVHLSENNDHKNKQNNVCLATSYYKVAVIWEWKIYKENVKRARKFLLKDRKKEIDMVRKARCCVGKCYNNRCYPEKLEIKSHATQICRRQSQT